MSLTKKESKAEPVKSTKDPYKNAATPKKSIGYQIKDSITGQLYKESPWSKSLYDKVDAYAIEKNIPAAQEAIDLNIKTGKLSKNDLPKYPYLRDGLAFSYAAGEVGNKKAERAARELAYTKVDSLPAIKKRGWVLSNSNVSTNKKTTISGANNMPITSSPTVKEWKEEQDSWYKPPKTNNGKAYFLPAQEPSEETLKINEIIEKKGVTGKHATVMYYADKWSSKKDFYWTTLDGFYYWATGRGKTQESCEFIHDKKVSFISNYKDVIIDAAEKYDIPPVLLAGIAYNEFGGDAMWFDDAAYTGRSFYDYLDNPHTHFILDNKYYSLEDSEFSKDPDLTSFGNTSIQVRRAIETLGYDDSTDKRGVIIESLKNPIQNIYITALHLSLLCDIDYKDVDRSKLTDEQVQNIASRYQSGPNVSLEFLINNNGYGKAVIDNKEILLSALGLDIEVETEEKD